MADCMAAAADPSRTAIYVNQLYWISRLLTSNHTPGTEADKTQSTCDNERKSDTSRNATTNNRTPFQYSINPRFLGLLSVLFNLFSRHVSQMLVSRVCMIEKPLLCIPLSVSISFEYDQFHSPPGPSPPPSIPNASRFLSASLAGCWATVRSTSRTLLTALRTSPLRYCIAVSNICASWKSFSEK